MRPTTHAGGGAVEDFAPSHRPSAWRVALLAGLAGLAVCSISVALDSTSAAAAEGDLGTPSVAVEVPTPSAEIAVLPGDVSAAVPSIAIADLPAIPEILVSPSGEAVADLGSATVAAASDAVRPLVSDVTELVAIADVPLDLPALPVPALPVSALPVPTLLAPVISTASSPGAATQDLGPGAASSALRDSGTSPAASVATPFTLQSASPVPADPPLGSSDGTPGDTTPPAGTPAHPRSSSGPSNTSYPAAADLAGDHPAKIPQRAILPFSWAVAPHITPSFDPGCTPD